MPELKLDFSLDGFTASLTLEGETGKELLEKAPAVVKSLQEMGATPTTAAVASNGNGTDPSWCPIHNVKMKRRERDGQVWYSHKVNGEWCRGGSDA